MAAAAAPPSPPVPRLAFGEHAAGGRSNHAEALETLVREKLDRLRVEAERLRAEAEAAGQRRPPGSTGLNAPDFSWPPGGLKKTKSVGVFSKILQQLAVPPEGGCSLTPCASGQAVSSEVAAARAPSGGANAPTSKAAAGVTRSSTGGGSANSFPGAVAGGGANSALDCNAISSAAGGGGNARWSVAGSAPRNSGSSVGGPGQGHDVLVATASAPVPSQSPRANRRSTGALGGAAVSKDDAGSPGKLRTPRSSQGAASSGPPPHSSWWHRPCNGGRGHSAEPASPHGRRAAANPASAAHALAAAAAAAVAAGNAVASEVTRAGDEANGAAAAVARAAGDVDRGGTDGSGSGAPAGSAGGASHSTRSQPLETTFNAVAIARQAAEAKATPAKDVSQASELPVSPARKSRGEYVGTGASAVGQIRWPSPACDKVRDREKDREREREQQQQQPSPHHHRTASKGKEKGCNQQKDGEKDAGIARGQRTAKANKSAGERSPRRPVFKAEHGHHRSNGSSRSSTGGAAAAAAAAATAAAAASGTTGSSGPSGASSTHAGSSSGATGNTAFVGGAGGSGGALPSAPTSQASNRRHSPAQKVAPHLTDAPAGSPRNSKARQLLRLSATSSVPLGGASAAAGSAAASISGATSTPAPCPGAAINQAAPSLQCAAPTAAPPPAERKDHATDKPAAQPVVEASPAAAAAATPASQPPHLCAQPTPAEKPLSLASPATTVSTADQSPTHSHSSQSQALQSPRDHPETPKELLPETTLAHSIRGQCTASPLGSAASRCSKPDSDTTSPLERRAVRADDDTSLASVAERRARMDTEFLERVSRAFQTIDTDRSGDLSKLEFASAVNRFPEIASLVLPGVEIVGRVFRQPNCFEVVCCAFDSMTGAKRRVLFEDFRRYVQRDANLPYCPDPDLREEDLEEPQALFRSIDHDNTGSISRLKLFRAIQRDWTLAAVFGIRGPTAADDRSTVEAVGHIFRDMAGTRKRASFVDFLEYFRRRVVIPMRVHEPIDRAMKRLLIIGPGFNNMNPHGVAQLIARSGYDTHWSTNLPSPDQQGFRMGVSMGSLMKAIIDFCPDVVACASEGGAYMKELWKAGFWTGPSLMINAHPSVVELPKNTRVVLAHGENDTTYQRPRQEVEQLMATGTHNMCFLYYGGNSGAPSQPPHLVYARKGDAHVMTSLFERDCFSRLLDAALSYLSPEVQMMRSWRDFMSEQRLANEAWLGYTPRELRRLWTPETKGDQSRHLILVSPQSEEFSHVSGIFKALPSDRSAYPGNAQSAWERVRVLQVERVQNALQMEVSAGPYFELLRQSTEDQAIPFEPGVHTRWGFHGTDAVDAIVSSTIQGFQPLASWGTGSYELWGPGTYFARDAKLVADGHFCQTAVDGTRRMLMCLLATGMTCLGDPRHRGILPVRKHPHHYHSSVDSLSCPEVFVLQHSGAALPAYLVTYK